MARRRPRPRRRSARGRRKDDARFLEWAARGRARDRRRVLRRLLRAQRGACALCGELMTLDRDDPRRATVDHIKPRALGGTDRPDNLQAACWECNAKKGCSP